MKIGQVVSHGGFRACTLTSSAGIRAVVTLFFVVKPAAEPVQTRLARVNVSILVVVIVAIVAHLNTV